mmetsp:Transcript_32654/g.86283  ORF Transcript_32654/g.86283 Transcript_32654/m.86283 type:complete len:322 (+) Transcript_32654:362-1327(+)
MQVAVLVGRQLARANRDLEAHDGRLVRGERLEEDDVPALVRHPRRRDVVRVALAVHRRANRQRRHHARHAQHRHVRRRLGLEAARKVRGVVGARARIRRRQRRRRRLPRRVVRGTEPRAMQVAVLVWRQRSAARGHSERHDRGLRAVCGERLVEDHHPRLVTHPRGGDVVGVAHAVHHRADRQRGDAATHADDGHMRGWLGGEGGGEVESRVGDVECLLGGSHWLPCNRYGVARPHLVQVAVLVWRHVRHASRHGERHRRSAVRRVVEVVVEDRPTQLVKHPNRRNVVRLSHHVRRRAHRDRRHQPAERQHRHVRRWLGRV